MLLDFLRACLNAWTFSSSVWSGSSFNRMPSNKLSGNIFTRKPNITAKNPTRIQYPCYLIVKGVHLTASSPYYTRRIWIITLIVITIKNRGLLKNPSNTLNSIEKY